MLVYYGEYIDDKFTQSCGYSIYLPLLPYPNQVLILQITIFLRRQNARYSHYFSVSKHSIFKVSPHRLSILLKN